MDCFASQPPAVTTLPLTLTLSPPAGRGDVPCEKWRETETARHVPSPRKRGEGGGSRMRGHRQNGAGNQGRR